MSEPKYYTGVEWEELPICSGCPKIDLVVQTHRLYGGGDVVDVCSVIRCDHIDVCRAVQEHLAHE